MKKTVKILLVGLILLLVVSTNAYSVENGKMKSNMMLYAGYQGVVSGEDSIHGAVLGLHSKFHIMGLPLFYYVDGNLGYPFVYNEVGEGDRGFLFTASASTGFGWKFMILDNLALDIGAGLELYNLMNITSDLGFLYDCQLVVDILAEVQYYFGQNSYVSLMFNPDITVLRLGASTGKDNPIYGGDGILFSPIVKVGIGF